MRPFEWLFLLSFVPGLLLPLSPQLRRRRWILAVIVLPALALALHLAIEGWRAQMIPLYILAALVLAFRMPALLGRTSTARRRSALLGSSATALMLLLGGLIAGWVLPVIALPQPSGPYHVGIVDRELVDTVRGRRLMVSVWYPAASAGTPAPLTHHPDQVMVGLAKLTGLPALPFQHLRYITLAASEGVPVLANGTRFPVLVFSHGMVGLRLQNSPTLQELASWGYIVVAIDHTDAAAVTVFPDGEARFYNLERFGIATSIEPDVAQVDQHVFPVWVADQRLIYDTLPLWQEHDPLFAGKLNLARIGSFGHSFGGATSLEVCRVDLRCRAAVNMDGGLYGGIATLPAVRPILLMTSADSNRFPDTIAAWAHMISIATDAADWLELPNSSHLSFTFSQLLSPLLVPAGFDPHNGLRIVDKYLRIFFDTHLRDAPTSALGPAAENMDVDWHTK